MDQQKFLALPRLRHQVLRRELLSVIGFLFVVGVDHGDNLSGLVGSVSGDGDLAGNAWRQRL
jgi:hypothetical protein